MSRFLFVVPPLAGHVNPTISVARRLEARGHQVAWVAHPRRVRPLLPAGAELLPLEEVTTDDEPWRHVRGLESLQFLWEEVLIPLARSMRPGVEAAIASYRPDVVIVDHQAVGGALAARTARVPWATFCTTSASAIDALAFLPKVKQWVADALGRIEAEAGLTPVESPDMSPALVVVFSTEALAGRQTWPASHRFVGPSIADRPEAARFPWDALAPAPRRRVFVSLGTVNAEIGAPFYATATRALGDLDAQVILAAPPALVPDPPPNFLVCPRVPQLALLSRVDAVVCHAGHNTVCEALAHGLPLVVAPIRDDQPVVASQVVQAGAGVRVRFGRLSPAALREAVVRVLDEPALREGAKRVQASFAAAGGAEAAADALEGLRR
jgi:MGT family glycosyltransferase